MQKHDFTAQSSFQRIFALYYSDIVILSGILGLNGDLFRLYVKYVLAPTLNAGDVVLLDILSSHKVDGAFDPIVERGAFVWFLRRYSPDLNPTIACVV